MLKAWFVVAALLAGAPAAAHYLWIEPAPGGGDQLVFGEFEENRRETAATRLGEMPGPVFYRLVRGRYVREALARNPDAFPIPAPAAQGVAVEAGYAVRDFTKQGIGVVKPMFYARRGAGPALTAAPLDIAPAKGGVRVTWRGKPLAGVEVVVNAAGRTLGKPVTDAKGVAPVAPAAEALVLETVYLEAAPGSFGGLDYAAVRHRATLSVPAS